LKYKSFQVYFYTGSVMTVMAETVSAERVVV